MPDVPGFVIAACVDWRDLDANDHMSNSAFLAKGIESRLQFFDSHGYGFNRFLEDGLGLAAIHEKIRYDRELRWSEGFEVHLFLADPFAEDGVMRFLNIFYESKSQKRCAVLRSDIIWMDMRRRRRASAPADAIQALEALPVLTNYV